MNDVDVDVDVAVVIAAFAVAAATADDVRFSSSSSSFTFSFKCQPKSGAWVARTHAIAAAVRTPCAQWATNFTVGLLAAMAQIVLSA